MELPGKGFDVTHVLGHTKADVDKELGHAQQLEDGPWLYDGFGNVAVTVLFDSGKAAYLSVAAPEFHRTPADLAAVQQWMHAPPDADYDHLNSFESEVIVWAPGMQDRQAKRRELAQQLTETLEPSQASASANGTDLEVSAAPGHCDRGVLRKLMKSSGGAAALKALGFAVMECSGEDGSAIRL